MNVFVMIIVVCVQYAAGSSEVTVHVPSASRNKSVKIAINENGESICEFRKKIKKKANLKTDNLLIKIDGVMKFETDQITKSDSTKNITAYEQALPDDIHKDVTLTFSGSGELILKITNVDGTTEHLLYYKVGEGTQKMVLVIYDVTENKKRAIAECVDGAEYEQEEGEFADKYYFKFGKEEPTWGMTGIPLVIDVYRTEQCDENSRMEALGFSNGFVPCEVVKFVADGNKNLEESQEQQSQVEAEPMPSLSSNEEVVVIANPSSVSQCGPSIIAAVVVVIFVVLMN